MNPCEAYIFNNVRGILYTRIDKDFKTCARTMRVVDLFDTIWQEFEGKVENIGLNTRTRLFKYMIKRFAHHISRERIEELFVFTSKKYEMPEINLEAILATRHPSPTQTPTKTKRLRKRRLKTVVVIPQRFFPTHGILKPLAA